MAPVSIRGAIVGFLAVVVVAAIFMNTGHHAADDHTAVRRVDGDDAVQNAAAHSAAKHAAPAAPLRKTATPIEFAVTARPAVAQVADGKPAAAGGGDDACGSAADCTAAACCHSKACVHVSAAPACDRAACTADCQPGTLDCDQARCECSQHTQRCELFKKAPSIRMEDDGE
jgi:hypothetical protein